MNILIVDDCDSKRNNIMKVVKDRVPNANVQFQTCWRDGLIDLLDNSYDLVFLDRSMPSYSDGSNFRVEAGKNILFELKRQNIKHKIVMITQTEKELCKKINDDLEKLLLPQWNNYFLGVISYGYTTNSWIEEVNQVINSILEGNDTL